MKLRWKFALMSVAVSAVPMAIAGYSAARIGQQAIRAAIEEQEQTMARQVAEYVTEQLNGLLTTLRVEARILDVTRGGLQLPPPEMLERFLRFIYHQRTDFSIVGIYDGQGKPLAPAAFQEFPRDNLTLGRHDAMSPSDVAALADRIPFQQVLEQGAGVGRVFMPERERAPQLVLAIKYEPVPDEPASVIAAQVSLRHLAQYLRETRAEDRHVYLVDAAARVVATSEDTTPLLRVKALPGVPAGLLPSQAAVAEYDNGNARVIGAFAPAGPFGLGASAERPLRAALRPVDRMGWATLYWMGVSGVVAALVALAVGRALSNRVEALAEGARQVAQGRLDTQLTVRAQDELGDLARAFNAMTTSLDAARQEILRQTREIKSWNETLERRVGEKSEQLRHAQDMLLRSRAMAAIGGLGAGVAHEINNPLSGVLGLVQLLLTDTPTEHPARPMLEDVEQQALRIREIVANLLRLSQSQSREDFAPLDLSRVVEDALQLCNPSGFAEGGIRIVKNVVSPSPPIRGNPVQLQTAIMHVINNARTAMSAGSGTLTLETSRPDRDILQLRISDTGAGIKPEILPRIFDPFFTTKEGWQQTGMGLSVVHKIVEDHAGTIRVDSAPGQGTSVFISFPIDHGTRHLT